MYNLDNTKAKNYITKGGYIIPIVDCKGDADFTPGVNFSGQTIKEFNNKNDVRTGWLWNTNGTINGLEPEWAEALEIVGEYPFPMALPEGFKWKGGFPKLEYPKVGEYYLSVQNYVDENTDSLPFCEASGIGKKRIILVPAEPEKQEPKPSQEAVNKLRDIITSNTDGGTVDIVWGVDFSGNCVSEDFSNKKEEVMKKETAIAASKAVGSFAWKTTNYWIFEPATAWGKKAMSSVRHVTFAGLIFGSFCMWMNPEKTMSVVKSCLPKISISVDAPDIVK